MGAEGPGKDEALISYGVTGGPIGNTKDIISVVLEYNIFKHLEHPFFEVLPKSTYFCDLVPAVAQFIRKKKKSKFFFYSQNFVLSLFVLEIILTVSFPEEFCLMNDVSATKICTEIQI